MRTLALAAALLLTACGKESKPPADPEAQAICEKFGARWTTCSKELMPDEDFGTFDVAACTRDTSAVAARKKCVEESSCQAMMDCYVHEITPPE